MWIFGDVQKKWIQIRLWIQNHVNFQTSFFRLFYAKT